MESDSACEKFKDLCQYIFLYSHVRVNARFRNNLDIIFTSEENIKKTCYNEEPSFK